MPPSTILKVEWLSENVMQVRFILHDKAKLNVKVDFANRMMDYKDGLTFNGVWHPIALGKYEGKEVKPNGNNTNEGSERAGRAILQEAHS